ncbi:MAG: hypothetical protein IPJ77_08155 [Planctomycetes bacterium]|nr:hypothetical protein [Planctomycetota bacterium]
MKHLSRIPWIALCTLSPVEAQLTQTWHTSAPIGRVGFAALADDAALHVAGATVASPGPGDDPLVARIAPDGTLAWTQTIQGGVRVTAFGVEPTGQRVWTAFLPDGPGEDVQMACTSVAGVPLWVSARFDLGPQDRLGGRRVAFDPAGNGYVVGETWTPAAPGILDVLLVSWDPSGALRFGVAIDGGAGLNDRGYDCLCDAQGNVYVTGLGDTVFPSNGHLLVLKADTNGQVLWRRTFDGSQPGGVGHALALDGAGNVHVAGQGALGEYLVIKLDAAGNTLWTDVQPGADAGSLAALAIDAAGRAYLAGAQGAGVPGSADALLLAYDVDGQRRWSRTWNSPYGLSDLGRGVSIGPAGAIELAVDCETATGAYAPACLRYDDDGTLRDAVVLAPPNGNHALLARSTRTGELRVVTTEPGATTADGVVHAYALRDTWTLGCAGDGPASPCPCSGALAVAHGCPNSVFAGGALLRATGSPSVGGDTFRLVAEGLTGTFCTFFQGTAELPLAIVDDGIGCVGGTVVRLGTKAIGANASAFPGPGDPSISVRGGLSAAGGPRYYQAFYRNSVLAFCPPATSNRTSSVAVQWGP